jgi:hypothetical protein
MPSRPPDAAGGPLTPLLGKQPEGRAMSAGKYQELVENEAEPDEPDDDEREGLREDEDAEPIPADVPAESAPAEPVEQDFAKVQRGIERAAATYEKALQRVMGEDFAMLLPSPLDDIPGYVFPFQPGTEQGEFKRLAVATYFGEGEVQYPEHPNEVRCETCDGWGELRNGSRRENHALSPCPACMATGHKPKVEATPAETWKLPPTTVLQDAALGNGQAGEADVWGRPAGHPHYGVPPAMVGA